MRLHVSIMLIVRIVCPLQKQNKEKMQFRMLSFSVLIFYLVPNTFIPFLLSLFISSDDFFFFSCFGSRVTCNHIYLIEQAS